MRALVVQALFMDTKSKLPLLTGFFNEYSTLCGYVFNHPEFENVERIRSNYCGRIETWIDEDGSSYKVAICAGDEKFRLGDPARTEREIKDFRDGSESNPLDTENQCDLVSSMRNLMP